ncbi:MAG: ATPase [Acidobacteriaceae bacterium]
MEPMSPLPPKPTILCISTYEKGQPLLRELSRLGANVLLLTVEALENADWPRSSISRLLTMPEGLTPEQVLHTVTYLARTQPIDRIVALDEFDLETAALLREHLRLPGLGESATRFFRDKLAMRVRAMQAGVRVPDFTPVFHYDDVRGFLENVPGPWLLKPRTNASAIGIHKLHKAEELWPLLDSLGDLQSHYLLERFVPGEIFHVEGIVSRREVLFAIPFQYGQPPMQTMHEGGVFTTRTLDRHSPDALALTSMHSEVLNALELTSGVTHTEFIRSHADQQFYFLETAARVGGAYIADVVEYATGLNPWVEWARLEAAALFGRPYNLPEIHQGYAGSVICLARQQQPDTTAYTEPEIVHRLHKHHHAGVIVQSPSASRVEELTTGYAQRFLQDFCASMPVPDKATA